MLKTITVKLSEPVTLPNNEVLTTVTLKKSGTGELALARAAIVRDSRFGREMVNDDLTLAIFMLPRLVVTCDVAQLPPNWVFLTSENDLADLATAYAALRAGFDSVEAFTAAQDQKQQALESGNPQAIAEAKAEEELPAGDAPTI